jgi:dihydroorotase
MLHWALEGEIPLRQAIDMLTSRPADLYGIRDKGRLVVGADADLAVFDLSAHFTLTNEGMETKCGWTPYHGMTIRAKPIHTVVRGHWAMREGARPGSPVGRPVSFTWK